MNHQINSIIFDYGGVISLPQDEKTVGKICRLLKISKEILFSVYHQNRKDYDAGVLSAAEYWKNILILMGIKEIPDRKMKKLINLDIKSWQKINRDTVKFLSILKKHGYKLAILSNMTYDTLPIISKSYWIKPFDVKVFSCEEKETKPGEQIYKTVLARLGVSPENALFIDDMIINIEAAKKMGINTIQFINTEQLISDTGSLLNQDFTIK